MQFVYERICIKEHRVTCNLNGVNTKIFMADLTRHIGMGAKVIYQFKSDIYQGAGEIVDFEKTLTLNNSWSKACLPATRTKEHQTSH